MRARATEDPVIAFHRRGEGGVKDFDGVLRHSGPRTDSMVVLQSDGRLSTLDRQAHAERDEHSAGDRVEHAASS